MPGDRTPADAAGGAEQHRLGDDLTTMRPGPAPSDRRTANSPARAADCALDRPPRLAQHTASSRIATPSGSRPPRLVVVLRHAAQVGDGDAAVLAGRA